MDQNALIETFQSLVATELARVWVKVTDLIPDVTLSPALEELVAEYEAASVSEQRFFVMHAERFLQQAYRKLQRGA